MAKISRHSRSAGELAGSRVERPAPRTLATLDGCCVAVHLVVQGREKFMRGWAAYEADADLGHTLRILIADPDGDLEFVVPASKWNGKILPGQAVGCDYLIRLG